MMDNPGDLETYEEPEPRFDDDFDEDRADADRDQRRYE